MLDSKKILPSDPNDPDSTGDLMIRIIQAVTRHIDLELLAETWSMTRHQCANEDEINQQQKVLAGRF